MGEVKRWGNVQTQKQKAELVGSVMRAMEELLALPEVRDIIVPIVIAENAPNSDWDGKTGDLCLTDRGLVVRRLVLNYWNVTIGRPKLTPLLLEKWKVTVKDVDRAKKALR